tara:strand:- start:191 stop:535 length:345 start_codon:yes stop_codon:yes gene_type:complete
MSIECFDFKSHASGALQGFANFRLAKMGIELFGCGVFMKNGKRWVSLPSREFNDKDTGEKKYISIMRFMDKAHGDAFSNGALVAFDSWCEKNAPKEEKPSEFIPFVQDADQVPF